MSDSLATPKMQELADTVVPYDNRGRMQYARSFVRDMISKVDEIERAGLDDESLPAYLALEKRLLAVVGRLTAGGAPDRDQRAGGMLGQRLREFRRKNAYYILDYEQKERHHEAGLDLRERALAVGARAQQLDEMAFAAALTEEQVIGMIMSCGRHDLLSPAQRARLEAEGRLPKAP